MLEGHRAARACPRHQGDVTAAAGEPRRKRAAKALTGSDNDTDWTRTHDLDHGTGGGGMTYRKTV